MGAYAGLQWKGECWCGNSYGKYGKAEPEKCNCERGSTDFGFWHQCIYEMPKPEPKLLGCYKDEQDRDMPHGSTAAHLRFPTGEREQCFEKCASEGYAYAGLQWKGECWCGNSYGKYGKAEPEKCNCERGSTNFGFWHQCIYEVQPADKVEAAVEESAEEPAAEAEVTVTEAPATTEAPEPEAPVESADEGDAKFLGCYVDKRDRD